MTRAEPTAAARAVASRKGTIAVGPNEDEKSRQERRGERSPLPTEDQPEWIPEESAWDESSENLDLTEWLRRRRAAQEPVRLEDEDRLEAEWEDLQEMRDESPAWVDLSEIDAMYAESASRGMADSAAKHESVEIAINHASDRQARPGQAPPAPSPRERARAAQRWEQNREYYETQHREWRL